MKKLSHEAIGTHTLRSLAHSKAAAASRQGTNGRVHPRSIDWISGVNLLETLKLLLVAS